MKLSSVFEPRRAGDDPVVQRHRAKSNVLKTLQLLLAIPIMAIALPLRSRGETKPPAAPAVAAPKPTFQVKYLGARPVREDGVAKMGDQIHVGLYGSFGEKVAQKMLDDPSSLRKHVRLYLNGVSMTDIEPEFVAAGEYRSKEDLQAPPAVVLQFQLARDATNDLSRKAWEKLLLRLEFAPNPIQIGIGLDGGEQYLDVGNQLKFQVASKGRILFVVLMMLACAAVLMRLAISKGILREGGANTTHSLGKSQMAFWGLLVAFSFLGVFLITLRREPIPNQVLILIGISSATGLGALLIGDSKRTAAASTVPILQEAKAKLGDDERERRRELENRKKALDDQRIASLTPNAEGIRIDFPAEKQTELNELNQAIKDIDERVKAASAAVDVQKQLATPCTASEGWFKDIISDANGPSVHRIQIVLWTCILGFVFVWSVLNTLSMPQFEDSLLLLMGVSGATYLGFKYPEK